MDESDVEDDLRLNADVEAWEETETMRKRLDLMELEYKARAKHPSAISARERINRWNDYHKQIDPERG